MHEIFDAAKPVAALPGLLVSGITAGAGTVLAAMTAEGVSGLLITGAGAGVTLYSIYAYSREKEARKLRDRIDALTEENEKIKVELYHLRAKANYCEAHHGKPRQVPPGR